MKARRYFWIRKQAHKHRTGYFFIKVVFDMFLRCLTAEKHFRVFYELRGKSLTSKEVRESVGLLKFVASSMFTCQSQFMKPRH